jgi:hypothetical protein
MDQQTLLEIIMDEKYLGRLPDFAAVFELQQSLATAWMTHRLDAFQAGLEVFKRLAECRDPKAAAEIYQEWVSDQLLRLQDEASSLSEQINSLGGKVMTTLWPPAETPVAENRSFTGHDRIGDKRAA